MGRNKLNLKRQEPNKQMFFYKKRINGFAKKGKELSILCDTPTLALSLNSEGKANLVLGPNTNFEDVVNGFSDASPKEKNDSKIEGIKALKKAFKNNSDHQIDAQQLMNPGGSRTSHAIQQGQQMQEIEYYCGMLGNINNLHLINNYDQLNLIEAAINNLIQLNAQKKMEMSSLRDGATAIQHLTNQAVMNHPGPLNGTPVNHGTNLLQPNMNTVSNFDPVSDTLMAAPPRSEEEAYLSLSPIADLLNLDIDDIFAQQGGFGAWDPDCGN